MTTNTLITNVKTIITSGNDMTLKYYLYTNSNIAHITVIIII